MELVGANLPAEATTVAIALPVPSVLVAENLSACLCALDRHLVLVAALALVRDRFRWVGGVTCSYACYGLVRGEVINNDQGGRNGLR